MKLQQTCTYPKNHLSDPEFGLFVVSKLPNTPTAVPKESPTIQGLVGRCINNLAPLIIK